MTRDKDMKLIPAWQELNDGPEEGRQKVGVPNAGVQHGIHIAQRASVPIQGLKRRVSGHACTNVLRGYC